MSDADIALSLQAEVQAAVAEKIPLSIRGGGSKAFYGRTSQGKCLVVAPHCGIIDYEPSELVITARAGTPLKTINAQLAAQGQHLAFEPPHFGNTATLGGTIACGFSGSSRPYLGAARDFVLGVKCITGRGEILHFGGQVMKNVAGYDVSRLMVGALGSLGVLLEISCRVLPMPVQQISLRLPVDNEAQALQQLTHWNTQCLPLTASCFDGEAVWLRLAGVEISQARQKVPAELVSQETADAFWENLREQRLDFFTRAQASLWRLSVPPTAPSLNLGKSIIEWGGGLRWVYSDLPAEQIRAAVEKIGGHATLFRGGDRSAEVFHPLPPVMRKLHERLRQQFDPDNILNPSHFSTHW